MSTPRVAVVVPAYNAADTIERCLASIAAQTFGPAEVIVIDDASTDTSAEVARSSGLPNLTVERLTMNGGPGRARNAGASRASSEWLAFLDADNWWRPTFLEQVMAALGESSADVGASGGERVKLGHADPFVRLLPGPRGWRDITNDFWRISLRFVPLVPSGLVVQRELFERVGGFPDDMRTAEDTTLAGRLWLEGRRIVFVNEALYRSEQRTASLTARPRRYRDMRLLTARLGAVVLRGLRRRRPGSGWLLIAYARIAIGRHVTWFRSQLTRR